MTNYYIEEMNNIFYLPFQGNFLFIFPANKLLRYYFRNYKLIVLFKILKTDETKR